MKAIVYTEYGTPDVLQYKEVDKPVPGDNDVLIKVHAASVNAADWFLMTGSPFVVRLMTGGLFSPGMSILGGDVAGRVEATGSNVTQFKPGDEVFGDLNSRSTFAEYVCAREDALVLKPAGVSFEQAAAVPLAGVTALQGLRKGNIQAGQKVLINGASGGVGTFAVQIAKSFGTEVTAVCSTRNLDMVRLIGADHAIDYTKEDFTRNGQQYDLILGANGYHSLSDYKRALRSGGSYVATGGTMGQIFQSMLLGPFVSMRGNKKLTNLAAGPNQDDLRFLAGLLEAGKLNPVIDRCYPLSEAAEALRYLHDVHASGKVVITVAQ